MGLLWLFPSMDLGGQELSIWLGTLVCALDSLSSRCDIPMHPASTSLGPASRLAPVQEGNHSV